MISILNKEIKAFLNSLIAYVVIGVFLTAMGLLIWVFPETNVMDYGYADLGTLFTLGPYVFMFLIPAITMRMFSEEKRSGTIEWLLTQPVNDWQIIVGKFLAGFALVVFTLIPTLVYYYAVYKLGNPPGNLDSAGIAGSYIGLALLGGVFTSIGLLASSLTQSQIVAFVIAVFLSFVLYSGLGSLATINVWASFSLWLEKLGILYHYDAMSKGLIDSRDLIYFFSVTTLMLMLTKMVLSSRKW